MRPTALFLAAALALAAAPTTAQTPDPAPAPTAATAPAPVGLAVSDVTAWLTSVGAGVGPVQRENGLTYVVVTDGPMTWVLFFHACEGEVCGDLQFSASFSNADLTVDTVNAWNGQRRFLRAFHAPGADGADPTATVQYDLILQPGGVGQLSDPVGVWVQLLREFATHVGYFAPEDATPGS